MTTMVHNLEPRASGQQPVSEILHGRHNYFLREAAQAVQKSRDKFKMLDPAVRAAAARRKEALHEARFLCIEASAQRSLQGNQPSQQPHPSSLIVQSSLDVDLEEVVPSSQTQAAVQKNMMLARRTSSTGTTAVIDLAPEIHKGWAGRPRGDFVPTLRVPQSGISSDEHVGSGASSSQTTPRGSSSAPRDLTSVPPVTVGNVLASSGRRRSWFDLTGLGVPAPSHSSMENSVSLTTASGNARGMQTKTSTPASAPVASTNTPASARQLERQSSSLRRRNSQTNIAYVDFDAPVNPSAVLQNINTRYFANGPPLSASASCTSLNISSPRGGSSDQLQQRISHHGSLAAAHGRPQSGASTTPSSPSTTSHHTDSSQSPYWSALSATPSILASQLRLELGSRNSTAAASSSQAQPQPRTQYTPFLLPSLQMPGNDSFIISDEGAGYDGEDGPVADMTPQTYPPGLTRQNSSSSSLTSPSSAASALSPRPPTSLPSNFASPARYLGSRRHDGMKRGSMSIQQLMASGPVGRASFSAVLKKAADAPSNVGAAHTLVPTAQAAAVAAPAADSVPSSAAPASPSGHSTQVAVT